MSSSYLSLIPLAMRCEVGGDCSSTFRPPSVVDIRQLLLHEPSTILSLITSCTNDRLLFAPLGCTEELQNGTIHNDATITRKSM